MVAVSARMTVGADLEVAGHRPGVELERAARHDPDVARERLEVLLAADAVDDDLAGDRPIALVAGDARRPGSDRWR